jgi:hypothetical protein
METEKQIRRYATNFLAEMMTIIGRYRGVEGENTLEHFEERIRVELGRYREKFEALRFSEPDHVATIDATERTVNSIADMEVSRARAENRVEYDHILMELYQNRSAMEKLLTQLDNGGK